MNAHTRIQDKAVVRVVATILATALGAASANAVVVMDQIGPNSAGQNGQPGDADQDFPDFPTYSTAVVDDFVLGSQFQLSTVEAVYFGNATFTTYNNVTAWRVEIYNSGTAATTSLTGNVAHIIVPTANATVATPWVAGVASSGKVSLDVSSFTAAPPTGLNLPAGTYWIAVMPQMPFGTGGQLYLSRTSFAGTPGNANARQANPGGGFALPGNSQALNANVAYRINATSTASFPPSMIGAANPFSILPGNSVTLTATVSPGGNPPSTGLQVHADLTLIGGANNAQLFDDGAHSDGAAGDNVFGLVVTAGPNLPCGNQTLPATVTDAQSRTGAGTIPIQTVSPLVVNPNAIPENEADCGTPTDTTDGGCNSNPNVFITANCGQVFSGTVGSTTTARDTDWYQINLNQETRVTWSAVAEADIVIGLVIDSTAPTVPPSCGSTTLVLSPFDQKPACQRATISTCLQPGTWWLFVGTPFAGSAATAYPCGRKYEATLRCGGGACPGDINGDGLRNGKDVQAFADAFVPCFAGGALNCTTCQTSDVNGDGIIDSNDVTAETNLLLAGAPCP